MKYWKKELSTGVIELHVQNGFEWGNDLTCRTIEHVDGYEYENVTWGTYSPLTDDEHRARGYVEISRTEAEELAALAGYDEIATD